MMPRKGSFGAAFIFETVREFSAMRESIHADPDELSWANDVLDDYFDSVDRGGVIEDAYRVWHRSVSSKPFRQLDSGVRRAPYPRHRSPATEIRIGDFHVLCERRRSVRWFKQCQPDRDKIRLAAEAAALSPSACNRQAFEFQFLYGSVAVEVAELAMGTRGFASNIPCLAVVVGDLSAYPNERDRHIVYIDASLAAMAFMLALETVGLSSCPINWPDIEVRERAIHRRLGIPIFRRVILLIAIGEALDDGSIPYSQKRSVDDLFVDVLR